MALKCYVDESSDGLGEHTEVMAGYVTDTDSWDKFSEDWKNELTKQEKKFFSASNNIFSKSRTTKNAENFYRIIEKHVNFAFCITVNIPNYRHLIDNIIFPEGFADLKDFKKLRDPFIWMYQSFFELSLHETKAQIGISEPIDFVFDDTSKYKELATRAFEYMIFSAEKVGIERDRLGAFPSFQDDKISTPLQAADLLARLIRTSEVKGEKWDGTQMPWTSHKRIPCICVELENKYFLNRLQHSFSDKNFEIYAAYLGQK